VTQQLNSDVDRLIVEVSRSHTIRHTHTHTRGRTPLNEWSARRRGRYLHNRRKSMPSARFETATPANKRLQTYCLDRTATGIGPCYFSVTDCCLLRKALASAICIMSIPFQKANLKVSFTTSNKIHKNWPAKERCAPHNTCGIHKLICRNCNLNIVKQTRIELK
jgi:hypothetical protein